MAAKRTIELRKLARRVSRGWGGQTAKLWSLWSAKWLLVARLVELRVNVLALDTDMLIQADPYPLLHAHPIDRFHIVIVPEGSRVNLGFIYVRGDRCAPSGGVASLCACAGCGSAHGGPFRAHSNLRGSDRGVGDSADYRGP